MSLRETVRLSCGLVAAGRPCRGRLLRRRCGDRRLVRGRARGRGSRLLDSGAANKAENTEAGECSDGDQFSHGWCVDDK